MPGEFSETDALIYIQFSLLQMEMYQHQMVMLDVGIWLIVGLPPASLKWCMYIVLFKASSSS